jgi:acid stress-induced BolA-like protein IbaG/YrbA
MLTEEIRHTIQDALPNAEIHVLDPMQDNTHLEAIVISREFEQLSLVKQHQKVMLALKGHFDGVLHALKLKTYTPADWALEKKDFLEG